jgi:hypothetical protein
MKVEYYVQILGRLWMPQCKAAMDMKITKHNWQVIDTDFNNLTLNEIEHYVITHSGDFSEIIDFTVDKWEEEDHPKTWIDEDGWLEITHRNRMTHMKKWENEDSAMEFNDAISPVYEYED